MVIVNNYLNSWSNGKNINALNSVGSMYMHDGELDNLVVVFLIKIIILISSTYIRIH